MRNPALKRLVTLAMLCAMAYAAMVLSKLIPVTVAGFLNFDLKDVIIVIAGFIFGPLPAAALIAVVSAIEMVTVSDTGLIGLLMNVLSSCAFCCTAAFIYRKLHTQRGAVIGLAAGVIAMTIMMLLWNYLVTPLYMKIDRAIVAGMLLPVFLPFNLIKAGINATLAILLYKPVVKGLRAAGLVPQAAAPTAAATAGGSAPAPARTGKLGVILLAAVLLATFIVLALVLAKVI